MIENTIMLSLIAAIALPLLGLNWRRLWQRPEQTVNGGKQRQAEMVSGDYIINTAPVETAAMARATKRTGQPTSHGDDFQDLWRRHAQSREAAGSSGNRFSQGASNGLCHSALSPCLMTTPEPLGIDWARLESRSDGPPLPCQLGVGRFLEWLQGHGLTGPIDYPRLSALHFEFCLIAEVVPIPKTQLRRELEAAGCRRGIRDITKRGRRNKVVTYDIPPPDAIRRAA